MHVNEFVLDEPAETLSAGAAPPASWSLSARVAFRFAFVYFGLYCLPEPGHVSLLDALPWGSDWLTAKAAIPWHALVTWTAAHLFHLHGAIAQYHETGSGDTSLDYVRVFCLAVLASAATVIWSALDRRRQQYAALYAWLLLALRFTLAFTLLGYGFAKLFPLQFPQPGLNRLMETYGESSPMGLLWAFMGASAPYSIFCGLAEVAGGLLLLFRRTATLGALLSAAILLNIVLLNFCYDVPVKLYSTHLELVSLFLLLPDAPALWQFFVLRRPAIPRHLGIAPFARRRLRVAALCLQALVIGGVLYSNVSGSRQLLREIRANGHPPIYGVWDVDAAGFDPAQSSQHKNTPWQRVIVDNSASLRCRTADQALIRYRATFDTRKRALHLESPIRESADLVWQQPDPDHLVLAGSMAGNPAMIHLHRVAATSFLLTGRGFHWINEDPFNR
jgi:uncharacterized membrane protein YphA (DoxX/SURF4 family)